MLHSANSAADQDEDALCVPIFPFSVSDLEWEDKM